jgi:superfamily II DNA or RNA helicase
VTAVPAESIRTIGRSGPLTSTSLRQPVRYYQDISIHRATEQILKGQRRVLLTLATGTGKTLVAFQICWRLWSTGWNRTGEFRKPRILYLGDRNVLVDDPKDKTFAPFGDARHKITGGDVRQSREMYFSTYQAIAHDEARPGLYREFPPHFFDLVIVDECHRGSARDESNWREILEYFEPAVQLGMTATPLRADNKDTYRYFGNPIYTYSLRDGIDDGFLAPYQVHRVVTTVDAAGWRPSKGDLDRYGREIPDHEYGTKDFERALVLKARTQAIARHLTEFMERADPFAKTIVFCVDQEHAEDMRRALNNQNAQRVRQYPDYVCRVTADEGVIGGGHLSRFQELETVSPVILTTSQLLTTGVDAPTCKNVVIARVIGSMTDFKQIIGRGTRVREDYGKLFFNIDFPSDKQTAETALLFLQLIMRKLRRPGADRRGGRAGVVVPDGTLFADGVAARIKAELLQEFNLHTIVRLPKGVFAPYTTIPTNVLFFDRSGPTTSVWYYQIDPPPDRKNYSKTKPMQFEEFADFLTWVADDTRLPNEQAWEMSAEDLVKLDADGNVVSVNLDRKNPHAAQPLDHLPPSELIAGILEKEHRIIELVGEIDEALGMHPE